MVFADIKNDFVFRRIFGHHSDILCALLNDLLDRRGEEVIASVDYLPSDQIPVVSGAKLSIVDVKCREKSGRVFVVEMQMLHMKGFLNRMVYNACKAYVGQLPAGAPFTQLADVVALSICDFELWSDTEQQARGLPPVPMVSRWQLREEVSGVRGAGHGMQQVTYAFLELPKLPSGPPRTGAERWAWLLRNAPLLHDVPPEATEGPYRRALDLANESTFSFEEMEAYRQVMNEIEQARQLARDAEARGEARGKAEGLLLGKTEGLLLGKTEGLLLGKASALLAVLQASGAPPSDAVRDRIHACTDPALLDEWLARVLRKEDPFGSQDAC